MTSVSVAVMAHRVRAPLVEALVARLDRPAHVAWAANTAPSTAPEARWRTAAAAWSAADPGATHHLVLQDDAVVCRDLVAGLEAALDATPAVAGHPVSIYYGNHHGPSRLIDAEAVEAARVGASWVIGRPAWWITTTRSRRWWGTPAAGSRTVSAAGTVQRSISTGRARSSTEGIADDEQEGRGRGGR